MVLLAAVVVIVVHNAQGMELFINPEQIAVLHPTAEGAGTAPKNTLVVGGVNCVVGLASGKFYSVVEDCPTIRRMMEGSPPPPPRR